jgi:hypothetical protein
MRLKYSVHRRVEVFVRIREIDRPKMTCIVLKTLGSICGTVLELTSNSTEQARTDRKTSLRVAADARLR